MTRIDLRSDTVTRPTDQMRRAMADAEVGDDVFMEDSTVNSLQEMAAERMGKEASLFVSSGTMGNLIAILAVCGRGDEVILGSLSHTFLFEAGGISALGSVHSCQVPNQSDGTLRLEDVKAAIRANDIHAPVTRQVVIENTHNRCGGVVLTPQYTRDLAELVHSRGLQMHLDGARIFNAAAALGVDVKELTAPVDTVTFCLSKGLCAPVGSVLCGSTSFIEKARRLRKQLGGGMRQVGILAAAGKVALTDMTSRLAEDHARAKRLAAGLSELNGFHLDTGSPFTNMLFGTLSDSVTGDARSIASALAAEGILVGVTGERRFRLVVHYWIDDQAVQDTLMAFKKIVG